MQLFYCRAGFEADCAAEVEEAALSAGAEGRCEYQARQAYALWVPAPRGAEARRVWTPRLTDLVFARQAFGRARRIDELRAPDRVTPLIEAAQRWGSRFACAWLEAPDSDTGRRILASIRGLADPLQAELRRANLLVERAGQLRLHICFVAPQCAFMGVSDPREGSPWPMGIPRLKAPAGAPSRSGMKLVEALSFFIGDDVLPTRLRPGRVAVDLGAAPGGWSQVLASRGLRVIAVDNGPIANDVLATQLVEHRREDAFRFRPQRPVDWMVCDVVAAPARIAALAAQWIARGWCRETIFNLKLPNKNRWSEIVRCRGVIERALALASGRHELRLKHLYHDREEVTAHLRRSV